MFTAVFLFSKAYQVLSDPVRGSCVYGQAAEAEIGRVS